MKNNAWRYGKVKCNYHTHTPRCNHATGTEREYIEKAISEGIQVLGFSDHAPYIFDGEYYSNFRMRPEETEGYFKTIRALAEEYRDSITILAGLELEYYPGIFERTVDFIAQFDCDYLIQGQHFIGAEETGTNPRGNDPQLFGRYVDQLIEGMETGVYTYVAHPDMWNTGDAAAREKGYLRICEAAKRLNIPLEINMLGLSQGRHYPRTDLFTIAAQVGNEVVLGCDTHSVERMGNPAEVAQALEFAARCGITPIELSAQRVLSRKAAIK